MGKIIKNSNGQILYANNGAFQVDASIDSNIVAGNIKEGVSILGVEGTLSGPKPANDVNFYDYDGTIVASYSAADFANLTAMPANPVHDGLTAQGWNWPFADAKTYVAKYGHLEVGQMYATTDGKVHAYLRVDNETDPTVKFQLSVNEANKELTIDWGDGTVETETTTRATKTFTHTYAQAGDYVLKIYGTAQVATTGQFLYSPGNSSREYNTILRRLELPSSWFTLGYGGIGKNQLLEVMCLPHGSITSNYSFLSDAPRIRHLTIPTGCSMTATGNQFGCGRLVSLSIPYDFTGKLTLGSTAIKRMTAPEGSGEIGQSPWTELLDVVWPTTSFSLYNTFGIKKVRFFNQTFGFYSMGLYYSGISELIVPEGVTSIPSMSYMTNLTYVDLPSTVTTIGNGVRYSATKILICRATTPPTITSTAYCMDSYGPLEKIYVPYSSDHSVLAAYKAATAWIDYESKIFELDANGNIPSE